MERDSSTNQVETTGRYIVLLPEEELSFGVSALSDLTGNNDIDDSMVSNLGVAALELDPDQLKYLSNSASRRQRILAIRPEQYMYATTNSSSEYLRGYKDGVSSLIDNLNNNQTGFSKQANSSAFLNGNATWGLEATNVINSTYSGRGIKVAVLDTGLDLNHPDFSTRLIESESFIDGESVQDRSGHGTHCIGTACGSIISSDPSSKMRYGIAYNAEIFACKVLNDQGRGPERSVFRGINWAIQNDCHIISMSLGSKVKPGETFDPIYEDIARRALNKGVLIVAAAGNRSNRPGNINPVDRPANSPSIMAVAALDSELGVSFYSNGSVNLNGGSVDIAAPGGNNRESAIYSTYSTDTVPHQ
ncbi:MAG: S8 family serine peptidase [Cyanobacteria bacterium J06588_4]